MNGIDAALADAARLRAAAVGELGYALAYGSHAQGHFATFSDSDLDLLYVGTPLPEDRHEWLTGAVLAMHHKHGLRLDTEVAYGVKLHATPADVDAALALHGFDADSTGNLQISPVVVEPWFLNSRAFKLRLILNALTTPHVFLGGNIDLYGRHCAAADLAAALIALAALAPLCRFTIADAMAVLVAAPGGEVGEDFLGYTSGPALHSTIQRGLVRLSATGVVGAADGATFEQDHDRRRSLVGSLYRPASAALGGPGTMVPKQGRMPA